MAVLPYSHVARIYHFAFHVAVRSLVEWYDWYVFLAVYVKKRSSDCVQHAVGYVHALIRREEYLLFITRSLFVCVSFVKTDISLSTFCRI